MGTCGVGEDGGGDGGVVAREREGGVRGVGGGEVGLDVGEVWEALGVGGQDDLVDRHRL